MIQHAEQTTTPLLEPNWKEIIPGHHQANYLGMCLEVEIGFKDTWTVYDVPGSFGFCGES